MAGDPVLGPLAGGVDSLRPTRQIRWTV